MELKQLERRYASGNAFDNCIEYPNYKDQELMDSFKIRKYSGFQSSNCKKAKNGPEETLDDILQPPPIGKRQVQKRNFVPGGGRWPRGVVRYKLKPGDFSGTAIAVIEDAMREISQKTCITFQEEVFSSSVDWTSFHGIGNAIWRPFILFINFWKSSQLTSHKCASQVGRSGHIQFISLAEPGCIVNGIVMHEIMHALGMVHEHSRPDRDLNVNILWGNISAIYSHNFNMVNNAETRSPYDISSVLQYRLTGGGKRYGLATIKPLYNRLGFLAGNRKYLTFYDAKKINQEYCQERCLGVQLDCQNEGYVDHMCRCACPRGLKGYKCESVDTDYGCGGVIDVSTRAEFIMTPRYPSRYPLGKKCTWLVKTVAEKRIRLELINMDLPYSGTNNCYHWVEVKSHLLGQTGQRICGYYANNIMTTTTHGVKNRMLLIFDSHTVTTKSPGHGLKMRLSTIW